jgi:hypothetical protein
MNSMRIIKLITPNNDSVNIEISGNENELRDLISLIAGITPHDIKGIKDKYGNYYTLSFAINNYIINSEFSDVYYLICGGGRQYHSFNYSAMNMMNMSQQNYQNSTTSFYNNNLINHNFGHSKVVSRTNLLHIDDEMVRKTAKRESLFSPLTCSSHGGKENFVDKCLNTTKELNEKGLLDDRFMPRLRQMIFSENEDIGNLFKVYFQDLIDKVTFKSTLIKVLSKQFDVSRPTSPLVNKKKLINLIESLENSIVDEKSDLVLLKNLIQFDNEFILSSFEVYEADHDIENFVDSIKRLVNRYKRTPYLYNQPEEKKSLFSMNSVSKEDTSNIRDQRKSSICDSTSFMVTSPNQVPLNKAFKFNKEIEKFLINNLHTEQRIVFRYGLKQKLPEIEVLIQYYEILGKDDLLLKSVKAFTKKFIQESVIKSLDDQMKKKFDNLIIERNINLIAIFKNFGEHNSLTRLENQICDFIKNQNSRGFVIGTSESDDCSILTSRSKKTSITKKEHPKNYLENLYKVVTFEKDAKACIEKLYKENDKELVDILEEWSSKKDSQKVKSKIDNLLKRKLGVQDHRDSGKNKILDRLEKHSSTRMHYGSILSINSGSSPQHTNKVKYNTIEHLLKDLSKNGKISPHQYKYLLQRYKMNDDVILSAWEVYTLNSNLEDLIESIKIFSSSRKINENQPHKTPIGFAQNKSEIIDFLKSKENREKDEIKLKQLHIIELLAKENMLTNNSADVIYEMIHNENHLIISAFEIFSVSKDHWDFCETLNLITDVYITSPNEEITFKDILLQFEFTDKQIDVLLKKYEEKDDFLLSALEFYNREKDREELLDSLNILLN